MISLLIIFLVATSTSSMLAVDGCPFLVQPTSKNISQGSTASFTVTTCNNRSAWWFIDHHNGGGIYPPGYDQSGISVEEVTLADGSRRSTIAITTSDTRRYNGATITATVYTPVGMPSHNAVLKIQGLLGPVTDVNYNITSNVLSWSPPPTLDGVPIHYYIITITSNTSHPPSLNTTTNMISLDGVDFTSCEDYNISIIPVNSVGNGAAVVLDYVTHVEVPVVMNDNIDVSISNDSVISIVVDYKIQYDCSDQLPVGVYATIREGNGVNYMTHRDNITSTSHTDGAYNGTYVIIGLSDNSNFTVQLVFIIKSGLTVKTDMFTFDTHDISDRIEEVVHITSHVPTTTTTIETSTSSISDDVTSNPVTSLAPTVTQPPSTVTQPPSTVTQPPSTVTQPPSTVTQPPSTVAQPPPTVAQPPSTVAQPPPTVSQPHPTSPGSDTTIAIWATLGVILLLVVLVTPIVLPMVVLYHKKRGNRRLSLEEAAVQNTDTSPGLLVYTPNQAVVVHMEENSPNQTESTYLGASPISENDPIDYYTSYNESSRHDEDYNVVPGQSTPVQ